MNIIKKWMKSYHSAKQSRKVVIEVGIFRLVTMRSPISVAASS